MSISLYHDYRSCLDPKTQRARSMAEGEIALPMRCHPNDHQEASAVAKCFLTALQNASTAFLRGNLTEFYGPITGNHTCEVLAASTISAYLDPALSEEAKKLQTFAQGALTRLNKFSNKCPPQEDMRPLSLICQHNLSCNLSSKMAYLVRAYLLHAATTRALDPKSGRPQPRTEIDPLITSLSKKMSRELAEKVLRSVKQSMNVDNTVTIQTLGEQTLSDEHELEALQIQVETLSLGVDEKRPIHFSSCFHKTKATLVYLARENIPFVLTPSSKDIASVKNPIRDPIVFIQDKSAPPSSLPKMGLGQLQEISPTTPLLVLEVLFNPQRPKVDLAKEIEEYGLLKLALEDAACLPQFGPTDEGFGDTHVDLVSLPEEEKQKVMSYRAQGHQMQCHTKTPLLIRICHAYAALRKEII